MPDNSSDRDRARVSLQSQALLHTLRHYVQPPRKQERLAFHSLLDPVSFVHGRLCHKKRRLPPDPCSTPLAFYESTQQNQVPTMNIGKKFDRAFQWAGEKMGAEAKTTMSDDFRQSETEMALRFDGG